MINNCNWLDTSELALEMRIIMLMIKVRFGYILKWKDSDIPCLKINWL